MAGLVVIPFRHGPFWNFSYLLACEETAEAAVIDPAWDVEAILRKANHRGFAIRHVLLTHSHSDHVNGVAELSERTDARAHIHADESPGLPGAAVVTFSHEESFALGHHRLHVRPTPGHSPGSSSFWTSGHLFTGDTLHVGGPGRPGQHPGAVEQLWRSTRATMELPPETVLHPGHDEGPTPTSTLGEEWARVPALRAATPGEFAMELRRATGRAYEL